MAGSPVYTDGSQTVAYSKVKINVGGTWKTPKTDSGSNAGIKIKVGNTVVNIPYNS